MRGMSVHSSHHGQPRHRPARPDYLTTLPRVVRYPAAAFLGGNMREIEKQIIVSLPESVHREYKSLCARKGITMKKAIALLIASQLKLGA